MKKQISVYVDTDLYKQFQIWCLQQNSNVTKEFEKFMKQILNK